MAESVCPLTTFSNFPLQHLLLQPISKRKEPPLHLTITFMVIFFLAFYSFAFGWELGYRQYIAWIAPRRIIEPRFRVVWRNPKTSPRKLSQK
jgi:hypothetical protein